MDRRHRAMAAMSRAAALSIAGVDSSGGAGIAADLRTFEALGVHGLVAVTAVTAQASKGVVAVHRVPTATLRAQIGAAFADFDVRAVKIGMVGAAAAARAIALALAARPRASAPFVVLDPVLAASSGDTLAGADVIPALVRHLFPLVDCLTPNLPEAAALLGESQARDEAGMARQGEALLALGPRAVLMKGGHLPGDEATDLLVTARDGVRSVRRYPAKRIAVREARGTGCMLSSAIAALVAQGAALEDAVAKAKEYVAGRLGA